MSRRLWVEFRRTSKAATEMANSTSFRRGLRFEGQGLCRDFASTRCSIFIHIANLQSFPLQLTPIPPPALLCHPLSLGPYALCLQTSIRSAP
mmetsp:Transcript_5729/g.13329  ORF Transcript_5729/g.13329 Transcript_5729/m.13329 type:complete len:92 (-) Transcript_5729:277-552(-)